MGQLAVMECDSKKCLDLFILKPDVKLLIALLTRNGSSITNAICYNNGQTRAY